MILYNKKNREQAINDLMKESFKRITLSFYKYVNIENPQELRDDLYKEWFELGSFGRIYIAKEGLNAQMSIPENNLNTFISKLYSHAEFNNIPIKYAVKDDGKSFYKLTIKVRPKIVADGLDDNIYDVTNVGKHLTPFQFHELSVKNETIVVDMRNHYESEVGKFKSAFCPDADTFREAIDIVVDERLGEEKSYV